MNRAARIVVGALLAVAASPAARAGAGPGEVVDRFQEAYRAGSVQRMLDLYAGDAVFEDVNQRHRFQGLAQLQAMLDGIVGIHQHMDLVETRRVVDGDLVVVEYAYTGQLDGAALGAAVGKEGCPDLAYELPATSWFRIQQGRIVHQKDYIDWATFLDLRQQMLAAGKDVAGTP